jgi:hypothetical protein
MARERSEAEGRKEPRRRRATVGGSELLPEKIRKDEEFFGSRSSIRSISVSDLYRIRRENARLEKLEKVKHNIEKSIY